MAGGFPLRKWASNCEEIFTGVPQERLLKAQHTWEDELHPTLGLRWHERNDHFAFAIQPRTTTEYTKRRVLAETARLFDPLGSSNFRAKILIQSAWLQRLDWDAPLPSSDAQQWHLLLEELPQLEQIRVHRWLCTGEESSTLQIHGFADASERGYAAAVNLRTVTDGTATIHLLAAKSKRQYFYGQTPWSPSTGFKDTPRGGRRTWPTESPRSRRCSRRHVPGRENPADCSSRGIAPSELAHHQLLWTGPNWLLKDERCWPEKNLEAPKGEPPEKKASTHHAAANEEFEPEELLRFSSLQRLLRVTACCLRWRRSSAHEQIPGDATPKPVLKPAELDEARHRWLRVVQTIHYANEITAINANSIVAHRSPLSKVSPFRDHNGVLRVGRRLKHAILSNDERHPMITPSTSWLTRLLIDSCHQRTLHGGVQLTLVEACLNSRPHHALSDDTDDFTALTPRHFLIEAPLLAALEPSLTEQRDTHISRWQLVQKLRDHFWQRWSREYLHGLTSRPKWLEPEAAPNIGTLCLLRSETTPPSRWPLARIIKLHPGDDDIVRVVTIRTPTTELIRPLTKFVLLLSITETSPTTENRTLVTSYKK
ncbi:uncharacterized protein LOC115241933 [Formica exsecta]|uniref:uncharacterized protein LOC115241933 n=1 Tax=Formica exsecta TaxID=72781 RepID=UPI001144E63C|nr:uncharacterized protein LOC115241933 [Formica exsecta]